jgi:endoribonuclease LACTB2
MLYFNYHSTNCFFIKSTNSKDLLAIDAGWPSTLYEYKRNMKSISLDYNYIRYCMVTHFHMDHAGLIGDFIKSGITIIVTPEQFESIDIMETIIRKNDKYYTSIIKSKLIVENIEVVNSTMNKGGFNIEIVKTNGHTEDSLTIIENDSAIIGDLYPIDQIMDDDIKSKESWEIIKKRKVHHIYPSHAQLFDL